MQTHQFVQGSPEWHAHRRTHFNASDAPAMLGISPYKTRSQLLHEMSAGIFPEVSASTQQLFDEGHRCEALARPLAEAIIEQELYPVTGSSGKLSASFDGLTMLEDIAFEHKLLNADLRAAMVEGCTGADLPEVYQIQMEQQCLVSEAKRVLFMASKWDGETLLEERHCWYESNDKLAARIISGWAQFESDLKAYKPEPAAVEVLAAPIAALPALIVQAEGRVVTSNMEAFTVAARSFIGRINTDLKTDQDFADAASNVKFCEAAEERLDLVKAQALTQMANLGELFDAIDLIKAELRTKRLALDKLVEARKSAIRIEIVNEAQTALDEHRTALNKRLGAEWIARTVGPFGEAIKGKRSVATCRDAANTALANSKIAMSALADLLDANRKSLISEGGKDWFFLFADFATVGAKPVEDFKAIAAQRIQKHVDDEAAAKKRADEAAHEFGRNPSAPAPVAAPVAPAAPVVTLARVTRAAPAAPADEKPTLKLGDIGVRLSIGGKPLSITAGQLATLGFMGTKDGATVLFRESEFPAICQALAEHILSTVEARAA